MMSVREKEMVGPRRTVTTDHIDFAIGFAKRNQQSMQEVKYARIIGMYLTGTAVSQKTVQAHKRLPAVSVGVPVDDVEPLSCMEIKKMQGV